MNKASKYQPKVLNRFTTIPYLIDLVTRRKLTLLNPNSWQDYNDRVTMNVFKEKSNALGIYALCLTDDHETIHHWESFAPGESGCCIEFKYDKLKDYLDLHTNVQYGKVEYVKLKDLKKKKYAVSELPYLKREPFYPENEFRIIATTKQSQETCLDIDIDLSVIKRITLTNRIPKGVFESVKTGLRRIARTYKGEISQSTLFNNAVWTNHFEKSIS